MQKISTYYCFIKALRPSKNASRGFTLIELLTVMGIITLLASIIFASLTMARMRARDSIRKSSMEQLELAIQFYYDINGAYPGNATTDTGDWPAAFKTQLAPYLNPLPLDPSGNNAGRYYGSYLMTWAPAPDPEKCNGKYVIWTYLESTNDPAYGRQTCNFGGPHYFKIVDKL
jgi:prepilin-type N-terminal cleavage/methylation domain-containing protein